MSFFKAITSKPWAHQGVSASANAGDMESFTLAPQTIALRTFLGMVGVVFGLFITAYFIRMELEDWRPMPEAQLLWVNTLVLFACSGVLQWTQNCVAQGQRNKVKAGLVLGGVLTLLFIFGQLIVWQQMSQSGYYLANNPANSFFYVLTGLHGIHILGGLWVWSRSTIKVWFGGEIQAVRLSVELCAVYWHFLLLVWLILFALLSYT